MIDWKEKIKDLEGWHFGGKGSGLEDPLLELVLRGLKTGTSGWHEAYLIENEPLPKAGDQSYILNSQDQAVCVVELTQVEILPFLDVSADFAYLEGEGDRSLAYWRQAHTDFFKRFAKEVGLTWDPDTQKVVCETFKVVHIFK